MTSELDRPCTTVLELVTDYLEDALPSHLRLTFETHAVYCNGCSTFLAQIREIVDQLHALPPDTLDASEHDALVSAYRERA